MSDDIDPTPLTTSTADGIARMLAMFQPPPYVLACPPDTAVEMRTAVDTAGLAMMVEVAPSPFLEGSDGILFRRDGRPLHPPVKSLDLGSTVAGLRENPDGSFTIAP